MSTQDPQDVAEQLDEDVTNTDPGNPEQNGLLEFAPDEPVAVDEEQVTEPIVDSVASRDERLQPETMPDLKDGGVRRDAGRRADDLGSALQDDEFGLTVDDIGDLAGGPSDLAPEEAALHVIDDANLG